MHHWSRPAQSMCISFLLFSELRFEQKNFFFFSSFKQWEKVEDWANIIEKFKIIVKQHVTKPDHSLPTTSDLRTQFLKSLCNLAATTSIVKVKFNLQMVAFHLAYLMNDNFEGVSKCVIIRT